MGDVNRETQPARPRRTVRKVMLGVLGIAVLSIFGTAGVAFIIYDKATEIDRTYPRVVVRNYVESLVVRHDETAARLYTCTKPEALLEFQLFSDELQSSGDASGIASTVVIGSLSEESAGSVVLVELQTRRSADGVVSKEIQYWRFSLVEEDGWRVCGAARFLKSDPSPSTQPTLR
jgi:hypothetical protein